MLLASSRYRQHRRLISALGCPTKASPFAPVPFSPAGFYIGLNAGGKYTAPDIANFCDWNHWPFAVWGAHQYMSGFFDSGP